jgi:hypothetical protein
MRFFIDYTGEGQSLYDYHGEEFLSSNDALDFAQTTAQTLQNQLGDRWKGWSVEVRSADGKKVFSLPIGGAAVAA